MKAFTLIETLIAISILILAILGPLSIAASALHSAYYASDQVTAFYLAQEGVEYMRYVRDSNFIYLQTHSDDSRLWDTGLGQCSGGCVLDGYAGVYGGGAALYTTTCNSITDPNCIIRKDSDGNFRQGIGTLAATNFYRQIKVFQVNTNEDRITSQVSWKTGNLAAPSNFQIVENVYNWNTSGGGSVINPPPSSPSVEVTVQDVNECPSGGTVTNNISPPQPACNEGSSPCLYNVTSGSSVTLTRNTPSGSTFRGWTSATGVCSGLGAQCIINNITGPKAVTAAFEKDNCS